MSLAISCTWCEVPPKSYMQFLAPISTRKRDPNDKSLWPRSGLNVYHAASPSNFSRAARMELGAGFWPHCHHNHTFHIVWSLQLSIESIYHLQLCWFKLGHGMVRRRRGRGVMGAGADVRGVGGAARRRQRRRRDAAARGRVVREGGSRGVRGREGAQRGGREHGRARHQGRRRTFTW